MFTLFTLVHTELYANTNRPLSGTRVAQAFSGACYAHERYVVLRSHGHLSPQNAVGVGRVVKVELLPSLASQERKLRKLADKGVHSTPDCFTLRDCGLPMPVAHEQTSGTKHFTHDDPRIYQHSRAGMFIRLHSLDERLNAPFDTARPSAHL